MDRYVTGDVIRALREKKGLTQEELAQRIFVSGKAVSKWESKKMTQEELRQNSL